MIIPQAISSAPPLRAAVSDASHHPAEQSRAEKRVRQACVDLGAGWVVARALLLSGVWGSLPRLPPLKVAGTRSKACCRHLL